MQNSLVLTGQNATSFPGLQCEDEARHEEALQAAPFTVRSTPDFRNTNGMEQKTVT